MNRFRVLSSILLIFVGTLSHAQTNPDQSFRLYAQQSANVDGSSSPRAKECACLSGSNIEACEVGYCIYPGETKNVVYYFHGGGGNFRFWEDPYYYTSQITTFWKETGVKRPTVISVSFGKQFLFASKNSSPYSGLFEEFENRLRPLIESKLGFAPAGRTLVGESMGAFNSSQLALRTSNYKRAALLCSVLHKDIDPFSSELEIETAIKSSMAYAYYERPNLPLLKQTVGGALYLAREFFPTRSEWKPYDPINLAKTSSSKVEFYIASGLHDAFVNYEGNQEIVKILRSRNYRVDWRPQWGGHCAMDIPSLAQFLARED